MNGTALAIALACALTWYLGHEAVQGVKWVYVHAKHAVHKVVDTVK